MRSTRKGIVVMAVLLAVVFALSSVAVAKGYGRSGKGHCTRQECADRGFGEHNLGAVMRLDLSDSQREQVLKIMEDHQIEMIKANRQLITGRKALREALQGDTFNEAKVRQAYKEMSSLREDRLVARSQAMNEIKAVLTPEQIKHLEERKAGFDRKAPRRGYGRSSEGRWSGDCFRR